MQQVLFVGGTSYSGSTLLDMMLSHDPAGFSCGELNARIFPYRAKHIDPPCGCGDPECEVWPSTSAEPDRVHLSLFENLPDKQFLVDSSKSPIWIDEQSKVLQRAGIKPVNVLIWKTPTELTMSVTSLEVASAGTSTFFSPAATRPITLISLLRSAVSRRDRKTDIITVPSRAVIQPPLLTPPR